MKRYDCPNGVWCKTYVLRFDEIEQIARAIDGIGPISYEFDQFKIMILTDAKQIEEEIG